MANGDSSYLKIADTNWWKLRDLFKKKVPSIVTPTYLATALSMGEASAKSNLIAPFKKIGIIDEDGKPTDLAYDWRDDHKYSSVCESLIQKNYPQELQDLFHSPDADFQKITNWFMSDARCGEPAAKMYARFYMLLLKANINESESAASVKPSREKSANTTAKNKVVKRDNTKTLPSLTVEKDNYANNAMPTKPEKNNFRKAPELHINIQLHISPESSAEQIDKIFESMAKHLKDFNI